MERHTNRRGKDEHFIRSEHVDLNGLDETARASGLQNGYLGKTNIPDYPKPQFQLSLLKHDTEQTGLCHIWKYGGFKDPFKGCYDPDKLPLVWWNLAVTSKEIKSAEKRLLERTFPNRTEEQAMRQKTFLKKFASSPAFSEKSRYGSYRFTFTVQEVLDAYSKQFCSGDPPILRVFKTSLYKKEVMYAVLVHRPENDDNENKIFENYQPLPNDPNAICAYREGCFFWNAKAMCDAHRYELNNDMEKNLAKAVPVRTQYYVWDHVALALHVKSGEVLKFDPEDLKNSLSFCERDTVTVTPKSGFDTYEYAQKQITALWPLSEASLGQRFGELHLEE